MEKNERKMRDDVDERIVKHSVMNVKRTVRNTLTLILHTATNQIENKTCSIGMVKSNTFVHSERLSSCLVSIAWFKQYLLQYTKKCQDKKVRIECIA